MIVYNTKLIFLLSQCRLLLPVTLEGNPALRQESLLTHTIVKNESIPELK